MCWTNSRSRDSLFMRFALRFHLCVRFVVYGQFMEKHANFQKREYDTLPHLQPLLSLQVSAKLLHVGISALSMRCAQAGCILSCATMHSSFLLSVFLQHEKHTRVCNKIEKITIRESCRSALEAYIEEMSQQKESCDSNIIRNKKNNQVLKEKYSNTFIIIYSF